MAELTEQELKEVIRKNLLNYVSDLILASGIISIYLQFKKSRFTIKHVRKFVEVNLKLAIMTSEEPEIC